MKLKVFLHHISMKDFSILLVWTGFGKNGSSYWSFAAWAGGRWREFVKRCPNANRPLPRFLYKDGGQNRLASIPFFTKKKLCVPVYFDRHLFFFLGNSALSCCRLLRFLEALRLGVFFFWLRFFWEFQRSYFLPFETRAFFRNTHFWERKEYQMSLIS